MANLAQIYDWFMTGKKPTQAQFWAAWGSFWNKEETIPQSAISNLTTVLNAKTENDQFNAHKVAEDAHTDLFLGKEDKTQKGVAGGYVPLDEFSKIAHQFLSIVNNLTTGGATSILSAEQGVVLQTQIDAINTLLTSDDINLDTVQELVDAIKTVETSLETILVNDLTTGGTTKALTAEMGKSLKALIDALGTNKVDKVSTLVDARDYSSLNAAISAIGSMRATLLVTNIQTTIASLTIPTNISIEILQGGSIVKNSADILVIYGSFKAGIYKVFSGYNPADITFGKATIDKVYPQWWGENTTQGTTNMTLPIQSAISSLISSGGTIKIPTGLYLVDALSIPYITNNFRSITIEGDGKWNLDGSTIYHNGTQLISNSAVPMFSPVDHSDGVTVRNIYFNGNNIGTYGWYGLYGSFTTIENCVITKFTTIGVFTAQGLCQLKYNYINKNETGVKWNSDGIIEHNKVIGNTGDGIILTSGGNYVSDNEIEGNGARGIYIDGTNGNNSNNIINNNYLENNLGWHIFLEGLSTANRTISKTRITGNYLSGIAVGNGNTNGGIKLFNARASNITSNNFIGSYLGVNKSEQQAILLQNSDLISISNFVGEDGYRNAVKIVNSFDITISDLVLRNFAQSGTSSDDAYGIYIDASCNRVYLSNIAISEYRGGSGYMKGIKSLSPVSVVNYAVSTPIGSPDSIFGSLFYKTSSGATIMDLENNVGTRTIRLNGANGTITTSGNISSQGLASSTGQITSSGSTTTTMFTMENANENRVYLIIARQSGSANNSVMGYVTTYGSNSQALNVAQSNTNPALFLTVASSGLNVQLTLGSGYGSTSWDWTYTRLK